MRPLLALYLSLLMLAPAYGQGFNSVSGRNHPELDWQVAETAHFKIMYPLHLEGIEEQAAAIAEATYTALSANLDVTFDEKIRLYLSDEDEIVNGFAVPLGNGFTHIWVHQNEGLSVWTGREKWLRKVIAHELAHIFHFRAVHAAPRLLNFTLGDPLPSFWTEGLAQYQTELWDAQRGDRWLRTAVLDDQLSYTDGRSIWNGRLLYSVGNAQVRYFAEQYGDSTLAKLLHHRKKTLLGLAEVHDFEAAFREVAGQSYRQFYDAWRRHINVYYNTLAGRLETADSLGTGNAEVEPLPLPGQYLYDVQYSPDTTQVAVLALTSLDRPIRRLMVVARHEGRSTATVAEGLINAPVAWSPDGTRLAFSRSTRGRHASLLNDLYMVDADGTNLRRLTHSRRASSPTFSPDGRRLAFIGASGGTANVFLFDLETGTETPVTQYQGDVQLASLRWHPSQAHLAVARTDADGVRTLIQIDLTASTQEEILTDGAHDDRLPVWSPTGEQLAYTSLRDDVPNVFVYDRSTGTHRRVTNLVTGATAHDWLPPDTLHPEGTLVILSNVTKNRDRAYPVDPARTAPASAPVVPQGYAAWTRHRPPQEVPSVVPPAPSLITARHPYKASRNLTHTASIALPYYNNEEDWGVFGGTVWVEPLGKHLLVVGGGLSFATPRENSFFLGSYLNNQWYPTIGLSLYRFPGSARFYGDDVLVEDFSGGDVSLSWPLDWSDHPYVAEWFSARLRYFDFEPLNPEDFVGLDDLPPPDDGRQADLTVSYTRRKQRPYRHNLINPLDGIGVRVEVTGALPILGTDNTFLRGDLKGYSVLPGLFGRQRLYLYGRVQAQTGRARAQDYLGFSRLDGLHLTIPGIPLSFSGTDRVRGFREFVLGNRVLFGTLEYRIPLVADLQTRLLGLVSLGGTALAAFVDGGLVWTDGDFDDAVRRAGVGVELKNALRLGNALEIGHAFGIAQPTYALGTQDDYDLYYRIRAAIPF